MSQRALLAWTMAAVFIFGAMLGAAAALRLHVPAPPGWLLPYGPGCVEVVWVAERWTCVPEEQAG